MAQGRALQLVGIGLVATLVVGGLCYGASGPEKELGPARTLEEFRARWNEAIEKGDGRAFRGLIDRRVFEENSYGARADCGTVTRNPGAAFEDDLLSRLREERGGYAVLIPRPLKSGGKAAAEARGPGCEGGIICDDLSYFDTADEPGALVNAAGAIAIRVNLCHSASGWTAFGIYWVG